MVHESDKSFLQLFRRAAEEFWLRSGGLLQEQIMVQLNAEIQGEHICCRDRSGYSCGPVAVLTFLLQTAMPKGGATALAQVAGTEATRGTSFSGIVRALGGCADRLALPVHCSIQDLQRVSLPVIAAITNRRGRHFIVIQAFLPGNQLLIADPAKGMLKISMQKFAKEMWTGEIVLVEDES
ncbi:MAG: cysteine peptidase family C39 domain-containing protein [Planctomycetota bacterium]